MTKSMAGRWFLGLLASIRMLLVMAGIVLLPRIAVSQVAANLGDLGVLDGYPKETGDSAIALSPITAAPPSSTITIPTGTRVIMTLISPLHSTSAGAGSGVYLETAFPVIQNDRVVIPAHTQVQGVVETAARPGHLHRSAQFRFRFTNMIFANQHIATIEGALQSLPGTKGSKVNVKTGNLQPVDQWDKHLLVVAGSSLAGGVIGSVTGFGIGKFVGAGLGAGVGLGSVVLTRGDELNLDSGTPVEMVLQRPLVLHEDSIPQAGASSAVGPLHVPTLAPENCAQSRTCGSNRHARSRPPELSLRRLLTGW